MAIITPYSDILLTANSTDFPALKHAFEYSGCDFTNNTITCSITGLVANASAVNFTDAGGGAFAGAGTIAPGDLSEALSLSGTTDVVAIVVYKVCSANNIVTGFGADGYYGFSLGPGSAYVANGVGNYCTMTAHNLGATPSAGKVAIGLNCDWSAQTFDKYVWEEADTTIPVDAGQGVVSGDLTTGITTWDISGNLLLPTTTASEVYGFYYFEFTSGIRPDIASAVAWMGENPGYIYPSWRYLV